MNRSTNFIVTCLLCAIACCLAITSCEQEFPTTPTPSTAQSDNQSGINDLLAGVDLFLDTPIRGTRPSAFSKRIVFDTIRGGSDGYDDPFKNGKTPIYLDTVHSNYFKPLDSIRTPRHLLEFVKNTGSQIGLTNDGSFNCEIQLSDEEVMAALQPVIAQSKEYLLGKGLTEEMLQEILDDSNGGEPELAIFAILMAQEEQIQNSIPDYSLYVNTDLIESLTEENLYAVDINRGIGCLVTALGLDVFKAMAINPLSTWTTLMFKTAVKKALTRVVGPVGALVFLVEWGLCYAG